MALKPLMNEHILLQAISDGDERAFAELFYAYHHQLGEFVFSVTHSTALTEEIVHDVFLKIWKDKGNLAQVEKFTSYLFIVTRNYTLNAVRKLASEKKKSLQFENYAVYQYGRHAQEPETDYNLLLENAVAGLPPRQQQVFLLKGQGLKNAEVASQMAISVNSVKKYQQWSVQAIGKFIRAKAVLKMLAFFVFIFF